MPGAGLAAHMDLRFRSDQRLIYQRHSARAKGISTPRDPEVAVGHVVIADDRQPVDTDGDRCVLPNVPSHLHHAERGRPTRYVVTAGHLEVIVGRVVIADDGQPVVTDGDRRELACVACRVQPYAR